MAAHTENPNTVVPPHWRNDVECAATSLPHVFIGKNFTCSSSQTASSASGVSSVLRLLLVCLIAPQQCRYGKTQVKNQIKQRNGFLAVSAFPNSAKIGQYPP